MGQIGDPVKKHIVEPEVHPVDPSEETPAKPEKSPEKAPEKTPEEEPA